MPGGVAGQKSAIGEDAHRLRAHCGRAIHGIHADPPHFGAVRLSLSRFPQVAM
jgi:hypothetical protein